MERSLSELGKAGSDGAGCCPGVKVAPGPENQWAIWQFGKDRSPNGHLDVMAGAGEVPVV